MNTAATCYLIALATTIEAFTWCLELLHDDL